MKMIYIATALMLMSLPFLSMTCDDSTVYWDSVKLVNYSNDTIYCADEDDYFFCCHIAPNDSTEELGVISNWKELDLSETKNELHLLIFKQSTVQQHNRLELFEKNLYDDRLDYTNQELQSMNFRVVYKGKEN